MTAPPSNPGPGPGMTARHGLLSPDLRRDLADLNGQYLDLGLGAEPGADPRFAWSDPVRRRLAARVVGREDAHVAFVRNDVPGIGRTWALLVLQHCPNPPPIESQSGVRPRPGCRDPGIR